VKLLRSYKILEYLIKNEKKILMRILGKEKSRQISYSEFSQFLHDFHDEYATVAFKASYTPKLSSL